MELSLVMKLRITVVMALGGLILGFFGFALLKPLEPLGAITLYIGDISLLETAACIAMCYLVAILAFLIAHPYSRQIAPLAVPTGLSVIALRSGDMTSLLNINQALKQRAALYAALKWEGFFWLILLAAAWLGVLTAQRLCKSTTELPEPAANDNSRANKTLRILLAAVATIIIAQLGIAVFAQDVRMFDHRVGSVVGQPAVGQIAFAVIASFAIAGFVVKKFLGLDYLLGSAASAFITFFGIITCAKSEILSHMAQSWPTAFYSRAIIAILPLQMVAFGALGSIIGYWVAVRYIYWRKHSKEA